MENGPCEDVFPIKHGGYSIAMLDYRSVLRNSHKFRTRLACLAESVLNIL